jgi:hypothetical protein
MYRSRTERVPRALAAAVALGALLAGCSDPGLYFDRRDSIALSGGDATAANAAEQTIDPWPAHSGNTNIAANGQKMQSAVERYRTNKVIPPVDPQNLEVTNQPAQTTTQTSSGGSTSSTSTTTTVSGTPGQ